MPPETRSQAQAQQGTADAQGAAPPAPGDAAQNRPEAAAAHATRDDQPRDDQGQHAARGAGTADDARTGSGDTPQPQAYKRAPDGMSIDKKKKEDEAIHASTRAEHARRVEEATRGSKDKTRTALYVFVSAARGGLSSVDNVPTTLHAAGEAEKRVAAYLAPYKDAGVEFEEAVVEAAAAKWRRLANATSDADAAAAWTACADAIQDLAVRALRRVGASEGEEQPTPNWASAHVTDYMAGFRARALPRDDQRTTQQVLAAIRAANKGDATPIDDFATASPAKWRALRTDPPYEVARFLESLSAKAQAPARTAAAVAEPTTQPQPMVAATTARTPLPGAKELPPCGMCARMRKKHGDETLLCLPCMQLLIRRQPAGWKPDPSWMAAMHASATAIHATPKRDKPKRGGTHARSPDPPLTHSHSTQGRPSSDAVRVGAVLPPRKGTATTPPSPTPSQRRQPPSTPLVARRYTPAPTASWRSQRVPPATLVFEPPPLPRPPEARGTVRDASALPTTTPTVDEEAYSGDVSAPVALGTATATAACESCDKLKDASVVATMADGARVGHHVCAACYDAVEVEATLHSTEPAVGTDDSAKAARVEDGDGDAELPRAATTRDTEPRGCLRRSTARRATPPLSWATEASVHAYDEDAEPTSTVPPTTIAVAPAEEATQPTKPKRAARRLPDAAKRARAARARTQAARDRAIALASSLRREAEADESAATRRREAGERSRAGERAADQRKAEARAREKASKKERAAAERARDDEDGAAIEAAMVLKSAEPPAPTRDAARPPAPKKKTASPPPPPPAEWRSWHAPTAPAAPRVLAATLAHYSLEPRDVHVWANDADEGEIRRCAGAPAATLPPVTTMMASLAAATRSPQVMAALEAKLEGKEIGRLVEVPMLIDTLVAGVEPIRHRVLVDTGSQLNLVSERAAQAWALRVDDDRGTTLTGVANAAPVHTKGTVRLRANGANVIAHVVEDLFTDVLLGTPALVNGGQPLVIKADGNGNVRVALGAPVADGDEYEYDITPDSQFTATTTTADGEKTAHKRWCVPPGGEHTLDVHVDDDTVVRATIARHTWRDATLPDGTTVPVMRANTDADVEAYGPEPTWVALGRGLTTYMSESDIMAWVNGVNESTGTTRKPPADAHAPTSRKDDFMRVHLAPTLSRKTRRRLLHELKTYRMVFGGDGIPPIARGVVHHVELIEGARARDVFTKAYRRGPEQQAAVDEQIAALAKAGRVVPSTSPCASCPVVTSKTDGAGKHKGWRVNLDVRKLNARTRVDRFPLPRVDDILDKLCKYELLSCVDGKSAYWQIPLTTASRALTATNTGKGLVEWVVAPFGLVSMPATMQRWATMLFGNDNQFPYLDDCPMGSMSEDELIEHVSKLLHKAYEANYTLSPDKCFFGFKQLQVLGYLVRRGSYEPLPARLEAFYNWPRPATKKELARFLNATLPYSRHTDDYARKAAPLRKMLTTSGTQLEAWTDETTAAFEATKQVLKDATARYPIHDNDDGTPPLLVMETDSSMTHAAWILYQVAPDGTRWVVEADTYALSPVEQRYHPELIELTAFKKGIERVGPKLQGRHFYWHTDSEPNTHFETADGRHHDAVVRTRGALDLLDFTVQYSKVPTADAMSRASWPKLTKEEKKARWHRHVDSMLAATAPKTREGRVAAATTATDTPTMDAAAAAQHGGEKKKEETSETSALTTAARARLAASQRDDKTIAKWIDEVANSTKWAPRIRTADDGVIEVLPTSRAQRWVPILPTSERERATAETHGAHQSGRSMYYEAVTRYWWPGMSASMDSAYERCEQCQAMRDRPRDKQFGRTTPATRPSDEAQVDVFMPEAADLAWTTWVDAATGYLAAARLHDKTTIELRRTLETLELEMGTPLVLRADAAFAPLESEWAARNVDVHIAAPRLHNATGMVEARHKPLRKLYLKLRDELVTQGDESRDETMRRAVARLNLTHSRTRGATPSELFNGRRPRTPIEAWMGTVDEQPSERQREASERAYARREAINVHERATTSRAPLCPMAPGDKVMIWMPQDESNESQAKAWWGPVVVTAVREQDFDATFEGLKDRKHIRFSRAHARPAKTNEDDANGIEELVRWTPGAARAMQAQRTAESATSERDDRVARAHARIDTERKAKEQAMKRVAELEKELAAAHKQPPSATGDATAGSTARDEARRAADDEEELKDTNTAMEHAEQLEQATTSPTTPTPARASTERTSAGRASDGVAKPRHHATPPQVNDKPAATSHAAQPRTRMSTRARRGPKSTRAR